MPTSRKAHKYKARRQIFRSKSRRKDLKNHFSMKESLTSDIDPGVKRGKFVFRSVVTVVLLTISYAVVCFHPTAPGVIAEQMAATYNCTTTKITTFSSMYFWVYAGMQPFVGIVADLIDASRLWGICSLIVAAGSVLIGFTSNMFVSLIGRLLTGIGASTAFISISRIVTAWFKTEKYSVLIGIITSIASAFCVCIQLFLSSLSNSFGWQKVFIGEGAIEAVLGVLILIFIRGTPEQLGFPAVNNVENSDKEGWKKKLTVLKDNLKEVFSKRQVYMGMIYSLSAQGFNSAFGCLWGGPYIRDIFPEYNSYILMTSASAAGIAGSLALPFLAKLVKTEKWVLAGCSLIGVVITLIFIFFDQKLNFMMLYACIFFWCMLTGGTGSVSNSLLIKAYSHGVTATALGFTGLTCMIFSALFQHFIGYVISIGEVSSDGGYTRTAYRNALWIPAAIVDTISIIAVSFSSERKMSDEDEQAETKEDSEEPEAGDFNKIL